jgi:hypothetical protein
MFDYLSHALHDKQKLEEFDARRLRVDNEADCALFLKALSTLPALSSLSLEFEQFVFPATAPASVWVAPTKLLKQLDSVQFSGADAQFVRQAFVCLSQHLDQTFLLGSPLDLECTPLDEDAT